MKVLSFVNQKGGVGKTTSCFNIAYCLTTLNKKVLLIDNDPQASLSLIAGINPSEEDFKENTVSDLYNKTIKSIKPMEIGKEISIIPSSIRLSVVERSLQNELSRENILKKAIEKHFKNKYDYILIDCSPTLNLLNINALTASDAVIICCQTNPISTFAIPDILDTLDSIKEINPKLKIAGTIATMFDKRTKIDQEELNWIKNKKELNYLGLTNKSIDLSRGIKDGKSLCEVNPKAINAINYMQITKLIVERIR